MTPFDAAWLGAALRLACPLLFAATGESVAQRAGVVNIGLEGMMLSGAFAGYAIGDAAGGPWWGILGALVVGVVVGGLTGLISVVSRADQIVVGVGLNLLALGATSFLFRDGLAQSTPKVGPVGAWPIPLLSDIPGVGGALFAQSPLLYLAVLGIPVVALVLARTNFGISVRAAGDSPAALDTAGVDVVRVRVIATMAAGGFAAVGGASLSVGQLGLFNEDMTAGRGFLALAAVIFGRWRPLPVAAACVLFGMVDALQLRLQAAGVVPRGVWAVVVLVGLAVALHGARRSPRRSVGRSLAAAGLCALAAWGWAAQPAWVLPTQAWLAFPYVLTLAALASLGRRDEAPQALGVPYSRLG
ncbi:MAG: branched-chain amino acid transporter permease [Acidimicrobiales bacterium]|nr:branched-chain amino acid transporter permease [Acidimicrobiales bacterium]